MIPEPWFASLDRAGFLAARLLLSVLWQSSILLLAAALIACALRRRRASARHVLWVSAVLAAPLLPLLGWAASSLDTPRTQLPVMPVYSAPAGVEVSAAAPGLIRTDAAPPSPPAPPSLLAYPWAVTLVVYATGAAAMLALVVVGRFRLVMWVRRGRVVTDRRVLNAFRTARARLGIVRDAAIVESSRAASPMTVGAFHPVVLLPAGFAGNASDEELEAVAVHELAHVKRHDAAVLALLSLVRAVLYVHPLIWLACRQAARLAEAACDDAVIEATGEPVAYARMLARLAEELPRRALVTELAAGFILSRSAFLKRVEAILSDRRDQIRRLSRAALAVTLVAASVSVALALALPLGEQSGIATQPPPVPVASAVAERDAVTTQSRAAIRAEAATATSPKKTPDLTPEQRAKARAWALKSREILRRKVPTLSLTNTPLRDALVLLREASGVNVHVFWRPLQAAGADPSMQLVTRMEDVRLETALQTVLGFVAAGKEGGTLSPLSVDILSPVREPQKAGFAVIDDVVVISTRSHLKYLALRTLSESEPPQKESPISRRTRERQNHKRVTLDLRSASLRDVLGILSEAGDVDDPLLSAVDASLYVDWAVLKTVGVEPTTKISLRLKEVRLATVLRIVLEDVAPGGKADFAIVDGAVFVSTRDDLETRKRAAGSKRTFPERDAHAAAAPWGPAVEGIQCRLRATKTVLKVGEVPPLAVDVRNTGTRDLEWAFAPECIDLELDGRWYDGSRNREYNVEHVPMGPGRKHDGYRFLQISDYRRWRSKDGDKPLAFTAGRHALRVAAPLKPTDGGKPFRVVSNPVEITIRPGESRAGARSDSRSADKFVLEAAEGRVRMTSGENIIEAEKIVLEPADGRIMAEGRAAPTVGPAPVSAASTLPTHILVKAHVLKIPAKAEKRALDTLARFGARASKGDETAVKADDAHVLLSKDRTTALMKDLQRITSVVVMTAPKVMLLDGERGHVWVGQRIAAPLPIVNHVLYPKVRVPTEIDVGLGLGIRCTAAEDGGTITVRAVHQISRLVDQTDLPVVEKARTETTAPVPVGRTLLLDMPASRFGRFRATGVRRTKDFETGKRTEEVVWEPAGPATADERFLVFITPTITRRPGYEPPEVPSFSP